VGLGGRVGKTSGRARAGGGRGGEEGASGDGRAGVTGAVEADRLRMGLIVKMTGPKERGRWVQGNPEEGGGGFWVLVGD
jgi:hypothetical protein